MLLFFERSKVNLFSIEADPSDTVLEMKQKIQKSTGISVSNQTIFFKGKILHTYRDSHTLKQCKIFNKSRLELHWCSTPRLSQVSQQPPAPSTSVKDVVAIEDSPEKNQDSSRVVEKSKDDDQVPSSSLETQGNVSVQEPSRRHDNNPKDLVQRESNTYGGLFFNEDLRMSTEHFSNIGSHWPTSNVSHTKQSTIPYTSRGLVFAEDLPLSTEHLANVRSFSSVSTAQEQRINNDDHDLPARPIREVINIPDSPESSSKKRAKNLRTVTVLTFPIKDTPRRRLPVEVNPSDNVEVLRTELAKMQQRSQLLLPEEGYFFIHEAKMLCEKQSFRRNHVDEGDTIAIFPGSVVDDHPTNTRT